jgi:hypothetical protein
MFGKASLAARGEFIDHDLGIIQLIYDTNQTLSPANRQPARERERDGQTLHDKLFATFYPHKLFATFYHRKIFAAFYGTRFGVSAE